mgnify:CR=1 FL=1
METNLAKFLLKLVITKIDYLNSESAKWRRTFQVMKSPYSFLRMMGFSPQMAVGLIAVGGTAGTGVVVNETILAERSFANGDAGIYAAPHNTPDPTLEATMRWREENEDDNTLRIVLGTTPVREIKIENVSVGTVYDNSALPQGKTEVMLIEGTDVDGGTATRLEIGELIFEKNRCKKLEFDDIKAHTINVIGNASDGQSINTSPGTARMRGIGGGHHQAEAMVTLLPATRKDFPSERRVKDPDMFDTDIVSVDLLKVKLESPPKDPPSLN